MAEQLIRNQQVGGSTPLAGSRQINGFATKPGQAASPRESWLRIVADSTTVSVLSTGSSSRSTACLFDPGTQCPRGSGGTVADNDRTGSTPQIHGNGSISVSQESLQ